MNLSKIAFAAAILAALGGVVWWSNKQEAAKEAKPATDDSPKILALDEQSVQAIEIHRREGDLTTSLKKDSSGKWVMVGPKPYTLDQGAVISLTGAVSNLRGVRLLDENATDLASYGLEPAAVAVTYTDKAGKATKVLIGDATPTDNNVYVKLDGDKKLFTMASFHKTELDKDAKDLREKHLLMAEQDKLSRVEVTSKGHTIEFGHAGDAWQILKPKTYRADGSQVEEIVRKVREATLDAEASEKDAAKVASGFAGAQLVATIRVTDPAGPKTLEIRKAKEDCYAKSSMVEGVYKVTNKDLCDGMDKPVDAFRNKKVFDFAFNDPTRVEVKDKGKITVFEKNKDTWQSGGKTMDSIGVQNLIDKLRDASAPKFVETGFTTADLEITVVSSDGKSKETVLFAPGTGNVIAKREGDATLYQMESTAVEEIRHSAEGIQPAAETKPDTKK